MTESILNNIANVSYHLGGSVKSRGKCFNSTIEILQEAVKLLGLTLYPTGWTQPLNHPSLMLEMFKVSSEVLVYCRCDDGSIVLVSRGFNDTLLITVSPSIEKIIFPIKKNGGWYTNERRLYSPECSSEDKYISLLFPLIRRRKETRSGTLPDVGRRDRKELYG